MEIKDIQIGKCYDLKVGKNTTAVRIMKEASKGGWEAVSLTTNNPVIIKSADRIVGPHNPKAGKEPKTKPADKAPAKTSAKAQKPISALDAALKVLAEAKEPLNCKQMIEAMTQKGYWKPAQGGKTPANTLHAAISKEIKVKGADARFEKAGRGQFTLIKK